jgi:hypothetical protein
LTDTHGAWRGRLARDATQAEYFSPDKNNTFANFHARSMRDFFPLTRFAGNMNLIFIFLNCPCSFPSVERFLGFGVGIEKKNTDIFIYPCSFASVGKFWLLKRSARNYCPNPKITVRAIIAPPL